MILGPGVGHRNRSGQTYKVRKAKFYMNESLRYIESGKYRNTDIGGHHISIFRGFPE